MPGEGPFMTMYLRAGTGQIQEAWYETYNCPIAVGCGSFVTRWVEGKTTEQAALLDAEALTKILGGLPLGKEHCASLTVKSLRKALFALETTPAIHRSQSSVRDARADEYGSVEGNVT